MSFYKVLGYNSVMKGQRDKKIANRMESGDV